MSKRRRTNRDPAVKRGDRQVSQPSSQQGETREATAPRRGRHLPPVLLATAAALLVALVLIGALALTGALAGVTGQPRVPSLPGVGEKPSQRIEASGRLLLPLDTGLSLVSLPSRAETPLIPPTRSGTVTSARWAPDGSSAVYAIYHLRAGDSAASAEIYLTDLSGEPRILVERDRPGSTAEAPVWSPDGGSVFFAYTVLENQRVVQRIERVDLASGARATVTEGTLPALSPDGRLLAHVRTGRDGDSLVVSQVDGRDPRTLIPAGRFSAIGTARFAPDGRTLAVPISVASNQAQEQTSSRPFGWLGDRFGGWLGASIAYAHGDPWEVFLLEVDGAKPRRLTRLVEDEIGIAWSPDGATLAVFGSRGLYLVDAEGRTTFALDRGGYGGIDWAP